MEWLKDLNQLTVVHFCYVHLTAAHSWYVHFEVPYNHQTQWHCLAHHYWLLMSVNHLSGHFVIIASKLVVCMPKVLLYVIPFKILFAVTSPINPVLAAQFFKIVSRNDFPTTPKKLRYMLCEIKSLHNLIIKSRNNIYLRLTEKF